MYSVQKRAMAVVLTALAALVVAMAVPALAQDFAKNKMCTVCHNKDQGQSPAVAANWELTKHSKATGDGPRFNTGGEPGVDCQACHGPGSAHVKAAPDQKMATIKNPAKLETREQKFSVCVRCHAQYEEPVIDNFAVGENILDKITLKAPTGGTHEQFNEMKDSKHFSSPTAPTCIDCHTGHKGLDPALPAQTRVAVPQLCVNCHAAQPDAVHSGQQNVPADATCVTCHMPNKKHIFKVAKPA